MKTGRMFAIIAVGALLCGCGARNKELKCIAPLPAGVALENLPNAMVPASFSLEDFHWTEGRLSLKVYQMDLYDAVELSLLKAGDTLMYAGAPLVVKLVQETAGGLEINGGQIDEGGCCLVPYDGGTYIARGMDDHATYTLVGKAELPLSETVVIIDCGEFPTDSGDTIRAHQKTYVEGLVGGRRFFSPLNTLVTIEQGRITEINRRWIP